MAGAATNDAVEAGINVNPYQGLKHRIWVKGLMMRSAGINVNPYQGLKRSDWEHKNAKAILPEST